MTALDQQQLRPHFRGAPGLLITGVVGTVALDPVHTHVPLCPLHALTGWSCPFCGSLRAVDELAHGHLMAALHDNVLLVAGLGFALAAWLLVRFGALPRPTARREVFVGLIATLLVFGVVRNLPFAAALRPL